MRPFWELLLGHGNVGLRIGQDAEPTGGPCNKTDHRLPKNWLDITPIRWTGPVGETDNKRGIVQ
eukprot:11183234-Lingulodinium_polyedra.AAC.1